MTLKEKHLCIVLNSLCVELSHEGLSDDLSWIKFNHHGLQSTNFG